MNKFPLSAVPMAAFILTASGFYAFVMANFVVGLVS
jgi:hypothetical protein